MDEKKLNQNTSAWDRFANVFHGVSNVCVWIAGIMLVLMAILIFVEVIARYVFKDSITGVQEISELTIVLVLYLGLGYATYKRSHVKVDVIINKFRPDIRMAVQGVTSILCILFSGPAAYQIFIQGLKYLEKGKSSALMHIPWWPFYLVTAFGLLWTTFEFIFDGIRWFRESTRWKRENDVKIKGEVQGS